MQMNGKRERHRDTRTQLASLFFCSVSEKQSMHMHVRPIADGLQTCAAVSRTDQIVHDSQKR